ncbi:817_t:CDS:2, partial [Gigaspora rosea]
ALVALTTINPTTNDEASFLQCQYLSNLEPVSRPMNRVWKTEELGLQDKTYDR